MKLIIAVAYKTPLAVLDSKSSSRSHQPEQAAHLSSSITLTMVTTIVTLKIVKYMCCHLLDDVSTGLPLHGADLHFAS